MEEIDLKNFTVVKNDNKVIFVNKTNVMLQNIQTGEVLTTEYDNVASYYGLDNGSSAGNAGLMGDNTSDYLPETIFKTAVSESSDDDNKLEDQNSSYRSFMKWEPAESKYMLALYAKYIKSVGLDKRFRTKKVMWNHIAAKLAEKFNICPNATQVESRFKVIARRTKKGGPTYESKRPASMFQSDIFAQSQKEDPINIDTATAPTQILMITQKPNKPPAPPPPPKPTIPPPDPSELLKLLPPSDYEDDNYQGEAPAAPPQGRRAKKPLQIAMFEKYLTQKAQFYERREERSEERDRLKAEREKEKDLLKQQRTNERIEREKEREQKRERRHREKMELLKQILNNYSK